MKAQDLRVGDRIRINSNIPKYDCLPRETRRVWNKLSSRGRSVRINRIDEYGQPWYDCRFKMKDGSWEYHSLSVRDEDENWRVVQRRK